MPDTKYGQFTVLDEINLDTVDTDSDVFYGTDSDSLRTGIRSFLHDSRRITILQNQNRLRTKKEKKRVEKEKEFDYVFKALGEETESTKTEGPTEVEEEKDEEVPPAPKHTRVRDSVRRREATERRS